MKTIKYIAIGLAAIGSIACSDQDKAVEFGLDSQNIAIGAEGGTRTIRIASSDSWIATTDEPWLTISPANGRGSIDCQIIIDSALRDTPRQGIVRIQNQQTWDKQEITIDQEGFDYAISVNDAEVKVENYAEFGKRYFDVKIKTNVDFDIVIPDNASWLNHDKYAVSFDRGIRPREVSVRFNWNINSAPLERIADVVFKPKSEVELSRHDKLIVTQTAAPMIEENTRQGDSIALLGIARSLNIWSGWNSSDRMETWDGVVLWEEGMKDYTPEKAGRVKSALFSMFQTKEALPFEVQYLTAAEELSFWSNASASTLSLDIGEYLPKLTQLKRLTLFSYGLSTLSPEIKNLKNLEYLDLRGNNFQTLPEVLTPENLPNLRVLDLGANQKRLIYDLSNNIIDALGGFYDDKELPRRLLAWDKLDTLVLSVNYFQGSIPSFEDDPSWPRYTEQDIANSRNDKGVDTLPRALIGTPKVLPHTVRLAINLNRLSGTVPDWVLHHPALDWWTPFIFIFSQEGKDVEGRSAGFDNEPANMDYYYEFYKGCKTPPSYTDEEEDETL